MGLTDIVLRWLSGLLLISFLVDCVPLSPRTFSSTWHGKPHKGSVQEPTWVSPTAPAPRTVLVLCHESAMEIVVKADLYGTGALIDGSDLRLGFNPLAKGVQSAVKCGAAASGEGEYTITAELSDCGTVLEFTDDWLVYKNSIFYSPVPLPDGIIRLEETQIPFKCHYKRQYSVDSQILAPTWIPFVGTQSAEDALYFSLTLLIADWHSERATNVYFLGEVIRLKASVFQGNHVPLRVFADACVATLVADVNSDPRYAFIENDGCLIDAKATGSRSYFLPRTQDDSLLIQLDAFRFHQDPRNSIFITCLLRAEPVALSGQSPSRACSYTDGRWTAADGNDQACGSCDGSLGSSPGKKNTQTGVWKRGTKASEKIVTIGPLIIQESEQTNPPEVLVTENSGTSVDAPASPVDPSAVTIEAGTVVDTPRVLPVKQENTSLEDPADLMTGQPEASNESALPNQTVDFGVTSAASTEMAETLADTPILLRRSPWRLKMNRKPSPWETDGSTRSKIVKINQ
ncbi:hypothetical protein SKAU_G00156160 [Synaphobranchus kaupii]|uniref:Zona pellucida sperm-binding protein 3 n=1 Tax=Synaphobranchus kaupii TaxID=118154 RepID=A0A9Q1FHR3_SYNKA|nr:hypothetical protein SKAU_G00156160 [Synaphobranchus kaupii]